MTRVIFVAFDGTTIAVEAEPGQTVMQVAVANQVQGINGECGGAMACGSCHIYLDPEWLARTGAPSEAERGLLEVGIDIRPNSRLSCQITSSNNLDGLVVHTPERQN